MSDTVIMPKELTADNGAKGLLSGEFTVSQTVDCPVCDNGEIRINDDDYTEDCDYCDGSGSEKINIAVPWTTIKEIYAMAVKHLGSDHG